MDRLSTTRSTVVVGVDGATASVAVLRWALRYAAMTGAEVRAVLCWEPRGAGGELPTGAPSRADQEAEQHSLLDEAVDEAGIDYPIDRRVIAGGAHRVLVDEACQADLLVLGSHGQSKFTEPIVGAVASYCMRHAPCPILLVPRRITARPDSGTWAAATEEATG